MAPGDALDSAALRAERDRLRAILESLGEAVVVLDARGRVEDVNAEALRLDRRARHEVVGKTFGEAWPTVAGTPLEAAGLRALSGLTAEATHRHSSYAQGRDIWIELHAHPTESGGATLVYRDVSGRRIAELALRESESRFRRIADSAPVPMWVTRTDRRREFANRAYVAFVGLPYEQAIDLDWRTVLHPEDLDRIVREQGEKEASGLPFALEARYRRADGEWRWLRSESQPRLDPLGQPSGFIGAAFDVTESKEAQAELEQRVAERTAEIQALYDQAPVPLHSQSADGRLLTVSDRWLEFMGYADRSEVLGRRGVAFLTRDSAERLMTRDWPSLLQTGQADDVEYQAVKRSGEVADVLISSRLERDGDGRVVRSTGAMVDITARRRTEAQLRQSQKMEAVGQLTGGVAHDFNNLLTAVVGSLELLRRPGTAERQARLIDNALAAAARGAKLTSRLLAFSRTQAVTLAPVAVNAAARAVAELLTPSLGARATLRLDLDPHAGNAIADANQLENALLNLGLNARDAMPDGGEITLATRRRETSDGSAIVELSVADTGAGMPPAVIERAFEPFFTTKPLGAGTGLGLSQVYGFARQSGGEVRIESAPGEGARVVLSLRAADPSAGVPNAPVETEEREGATGRVLVVDDDAEVRAALTALIEDLGYTTESAADGAEGLARAAAAAFDLVLLDYAMPGMTGAECARRLRAARPGLPIVFATGYADMRALTEAVGDAPVLRKPFTLRDLSETLRAALACR